MVPQQLNKGASFKLCDKILTNNSIPFLDAELIEYITWNLDDKSLSHFVSKVMPWLINPQQALNKEARY